MKLLPLFCLLLSPVPTMGQVNSRAAGLYEKSVELHNKNLFKETIETLNQCLYIDPGFIDAYSLRASTKEMVNDLDGALNDYNACLEFKPDQFEVLLSRASLLFRMKKYDRARSDFEKLLKLPPGETTTVYYRKLSGSEGIDQIMTAQGPVKSQVFNYLGLIETQLGNCNKGITWLDSAIFWNNKEADYFVNRALARQACNDSTFRNDFQRALNLNPYHPLARHNLAVLSAKSGSLDLAEQQLTEVIKTDPNLEGVYLERAYHRLVKGNYAGALEDYNRALRLNSTDPEVWLNRGIVKEKLNDRAGAFADYTQAIELQESFSRAWLNRGNLFLKQGKFSKAVEDYSVAITYQADYGSAYYNRAIARYRLKQNEEACNDLLQAEKTGMEISPKIRNSICKN